MKAKDVEVGGFIKPTRPLNNGYIYMEQIPQVGEPLRHEGYYNGNRSQQCVGITNGQSKFYYLSPESEVEPLEGKVLEEFAEEVRVVTLPIYKGGCTMGSDPEVFLLDKNGEVLPAFLFLPSKKEREEDPKMDMHSYVKTSYGFWDGFQAEFTTIAPYCHQELVSGIRLSLLRVLEQARKVAPEATLTHKSVVDIPLLMMQNTSPIHQALGCAPSKNIYTEKTSLEGVEGSLIPFRFAGCHFHFSATKSQMQKAEKAMVWMLDAIAGVASVGLLQGLEDPRRRKFYGVAGEYRTPAHGLEWRVPSSTLLVHPVALHFLLDIARTAFTMALQGNEKLWEASPEEVQDVINNYDIEGAIKILKRNAIIWERILRVNYGNADYPGGKNARVLAEKGIKEFYSTNMEKNWHLWRGTDGWHSSNDIYVSTMSK